MSSRRLTALLLGLALLPSAVIGRGMGCLMPSGDAGSPATGAMAAEHTAHATADEHRSHSASAVVSGDTERGSPTGAPHVPTECLSATACAGVALGAPSGLMASTFPRDSGVTTDVALAPRSPAFALEPPPPRA